MWPGQINPTSQMAWNTACACPFSLDEALFASQRSETKALQDNWRSKPGEIRLWGHAKQQKSRARPTQEPRHPLAAANLAWPDAAVVVSHNTYTRLSQSQRCLLLQQDHGRKNLDPSAMGGKDSVEITNRIWWVALPVQSQDSYNLAERVSKLEAESEQRKGWEAERRQWEIKAEAWASTTCCVLHHRF